jgi:hypothetical protein
MVTYLYNLPNATNGTDAILTQTVTAMPSLAPLILLFVYFVVFLGGSTRQKLRNGTADYAAWSTVASVITLFIALMMSTITGIIRLDWLVVIVAVTILSGVWLFLDRKPQEL